MTIRHAICLFFVLTITAHTYASEHDDTAETFDLRAISCEELAIMPEEQQGYVIVMIFGYQAGQSESPVQTPASIESQIETAYETCAAQPELTILDAMAAAAKVNTP